MANALFTAAKKAILDADIDLLVVDVRVVLIDSADDTIAPATDDMLDDILAAARVATTAAGMTSKTTTGGTFDGADSTFTAVSGDQSEQVVIYNNTPGTEATKNLIVFFDTFSSGMPVTPNGGDITIQWNASGIFSI